MNEKEDYMKNLEEYRKEINKLDDKLINLLNERGKFIQEIVRLKKVLDIDIDQPLREKEIINRVKKKSTILKPSSIEAIWNEIFNASKLLQE